MAAGPDGRYVGDVPARRRKRPSAAAVSPSSTEATDPTRDAARLFAERYAADKENEKAAQRARRAAAEREAHHDGLIRAKDGAADALKRVRRNGGSAAAMAAAEEAYRVALAALLDAERDRDG